MVLIQGSFNAKSLLATIGLIATIVFLGQFSTSLPALFLYGVLIVVALLIPYRNVGNDILLRILGCSSIGVGIWFYLWQIGSFTSLLLYIMVGILAIILPSVLPQNILE